MKKILVICALLLPVAACKSSTASIKKDSQEAIIIIEGGKEGARALEPFVEPGGMLILKSQQKRWERLEKLAKSIRGNADDVKDKSNWFVAQFERLGRLAMWAVAIMVLWFVLKVAVKAGAVPGAGQLLTGLAKKGLGVAREVKTQATLLAKAKTAAKESGNHAVADKVNSAITAFREASPGHEGAYQRAKAATKAAAENTTK